MNNVVSDLFSGTVAFIYLILFVLVYFPGGTIFMASMCNNSRLDGWDWVLSVVIPGYGLARGLFFPC